MKKTLFSICLLLFIVSVLYLSDSPAQNYAQWHLPEGAKARLGKGKINDVQLSPDGSQLAVATSIGIWLHDAHSGEELDLLNPMKEVLSISFSPEGAMLAGGSPNGTIHLWDATTGKKIKTLTGHTNAVISLTFSPDGTTLVSGSWDKTIRLWDTTIEEEIKILRPTDGVTSLAFSPNGLTFASGDQDKTIHLWDAATGKRIGSFKGHTKRIIGLMFSLDGATLFSTGWDKTIRLWDATTRTNLKTFSGYMSYINNITFSSDGATLAIVDGLSFNSDIYLWDATTGKHIKTLAGSLAFSPNITVYSLAFSPDSAILAGGGHGYIHLWDVATKEHIETFVGEDGLSVVSDRLEITDLVFSPDGAILAWRSYGSNSTNLWDVATKEHIKTLTGDTFAFSPDGAILASGGNASINLWNVATGEHIKKELPGHIATVYSLAFSPDGAILASGEGNASINLWNVATGEHIRMLKAHKNRPWIRDLAFSPDGTTLAGGYTRDIEHIGRGVITGSLWNVATGEHTRILTTIHQHGDYRVSFNTDGATLASADVGGATVLLWDLDATPLLQREIPEDVNSDGILNIQDLVLVAASFGQTGLNAADVNGDGIVDIRDIVKVAGAIAAAAAAPPVNPQALAMLTTVEVQQWLGQAQQLNLTDPVSQRGIRFLEQLVIALTPKETALLPNYPNPFNPETWIPYQLAEPAEATLTIYAVDGTVTRTLELGHQPIGVYHDRHRAARWDGKNERGEAVASGVYFYTLTAGEFKATRKMIIQK